MKTLEQFRMMPDDDLILHGKETPSYSDDYVYALIQRLEDTVDALARLQSEMDERNKWRGVDPDDDQ